MADVTNDTNDTNDLSLLLPSAPAAALARYAIMDDFTAVRRPDFALGGLFGPAAAERLDAIGLAPGQLATQPPLSHVEIPPSPGKTGPTTGPIWLVRARELGAD